MTGRLKLCRIITARDTCTEEENRNILKQQLFAEPPSQYQLTASRVAQCLILNFSPKSLLLYVNLFFFFVIKLPCH